jgi:outer membrane protein assembly factor BamB
MIIPVSLGLDVKTTVERESLSIVYNDEPSEHIWPMYCYNAQHTGRSPYNTASNPGFEKWFFKTGSFVEGSAAIDQEGIIYFGSWDNDFRALYPNGTLKWKHDIRGNVESTGPAIDENGIIYVGTAHADSANYLFAFYPNGTVKWTYKAGNNIYGSPVIGNDGTIYFSTDSGYPWHGYVFALYPNGTLKWKYKTPDVTYSNPAIGLDGTIYCGCHNGKLYALNPENGTLKWSYSTGNWVYYGPCIYDDGTVIFGSHSNNLYALYPNGTLKWKTSMVATTTPVIGPDGTIYAGRSRLYAINPNDGSIIWSYDIPGWISEGNPCVSADGIIYCGTLEPGYIVAVNSDGTLRWQKHIGKCLFAPIIGEDGTVYIGSSHDEYDEDLGGYVLAGYLRAFNDLDIDAPSEPVIIGPDEGKTGVKYKFSFSSTSPVGKKLFYFVDWGDKDVSGWIGPYDSGELVLLNHSIVEWNPSKKVYNIRVKVKDEDDRWGPWGYHDFNIPRTLVTHSSVWLRFLDIFPILERILGLKR